MSRATSSSSAVRRLPSRTTALPLTAIASARASLDRLVDLRSTSPWLLLGTARLQLLDRFRSQGGSDLRTLERLEFTPGPGNRFTQPDQEAHMSVRRLVARRLVRPSSREKKPRRNRTGLFAVLTLGAGGLSGVAALLGVPPFGNLQTLVTQFLHPDSPSPIEAHTLFPPVPPVQKVVDIYDPAPPAPRPPVQAAPQPAPQPAPQASPQPPEARPTPRPPHASPTPTPIQSSPSPSPHGGD